MSKVKRYRKESDSLGTVEVPVDALYGAQTQRAIDNFPISGRPMPAAFIHAVLQIKACAARVNAELGELEADIAAAIAEACEQLLSGDYLNQFPVDMFQTGSGTSTNMNVNEVVAKLAENALGNQVSPNDHVNCGQSSNDVIPSAIHLSALTQLETLLLPALDHLAKTLSRRAAGCTYAVKTGRTHLMDAMPVTLEQEINAWVAQLRKAEQRLKGLRPQLAELAIGGTAVGTGVNAAPGFGQRVADELSGVTGLKLRAAAAPFDLMASQDVAVALSGELKALAVALTKICNDLRWMNSGPLSGLAEIRLPALQPGSSIMPGKVNPVIPEAVLMVAAAVVGNDTTITLAGQSGNFQLNVMLPLVASKLLESTEWLANGCRVLADKAVAGFEINADAMNAGLSRNPVLVTALNPVIGYMAAAKIAKTAYAQQRPIIDVAEEMTDLSRDELERLLDPARLT